MQLGRFLVEAVVLGKQSPNRLVREHPISRSWFYELLARYRREGPAGLEPRTHRPARCPHQVDQAIVDVVLELRTDLLAAGLDAGPQTILHHLAGRFPKTPSRVTVWRILKRQGLITPQPTNARGLPLFALRLSCPTSSGKPTPPSGTSPTPARSRSST
jgi:hypothetical protein